VQGGDISNAEAPRLWFVCEGLVLIPVKTQTFTMPGKRMGSKRRAENAVRAAYEFNTYIFKRVWDLTYRLDYRCSVVTFNTDELWLEVVQEWFDEIDFPAPLRAYTPERFMDEVVTLPSCARVFDPDPSNRFRYGAKSAVISPHFDFEPLA
jgi:hypothetical protein